MPTRRSFLKAGAGLGAALAGLARAGAQGGALGHAAPDAAPLVPGPDGLLAVPEGFRYTTFSRAGETMDDGLRVPRAHDGMAAFAGADGRTVLVRNHELEPGTGEGGAFGDALELLDRVEPALVFDRGHGNFPALGGTTTLVYDTGAQRLVSHRLSLAGTARNCAGGPTPWGSWITCEEAVYRAGKRLERDHGWCFEVPAAHEGLVAPVALEDLGRMNHEAVAVDPRTGVVYLTEDREDGALYRFLPRKPGELARGGKLQALRVLEAQSLDTRNWHRFANVPAREPLAVTWMPLSRVAAPDDDLRYQAFDARGAARFARGEGMAFADGAVWFCCTSGGARRAGQVWRYVPSPHEGTDAERDAPGTLELFLEPDDPALVDMCDNLVVSPWGDLVLAEDGGAEDRLQGVTPDGAVYPIARNLAGHGELAGPTFSPDGTTLFFNVQWQGVTVALTGPWERLRRPG